MDIKEINKKENEKIVFTSNDDKKYIFEKLKTKNIYIPFFNKSFHTIKRNKYNSIVTEWNGYYYALLKINLEENDRKIRMYDLYLFSSTRIPFHLVKSNNYIIMWKEKLFFLEKYLNEKYEEKYYDYNYFLYLGKNALNILKKVDFDNVTYGFCFNRFDNINTLYSIYDPFNIKTGPIMNSFSEFIKYELFKNGNKDQIDCIFHLNITEDDILLLISRLLFPTHYYDLFLNDNFNNQYNIIIDRQNNLYEIIKQIIKIVKKRNIISDISIIEKLVNQL